MLSPNELNTFDDFDYGSMGSYGDAGSLGSVAEELRKQLGIPEPEDDAAKKTRFAEALQKVEATHIAVTEALTAPVKNERFSLKQFYLPIFILLMMAVLSGAPLELVKELPGHQAIAQTNTSISLPESVNGSVAEIATNIIAQARENIPEPDLQSTEAPEEVVIAEAEPEVEVTAEAPLIVEAEPEVADVLSENDELSAPVTPTELLGEPLVIDHISLLFSYDGNNQRFNINRYIHGWGTWEHEEAEYDIVKSSSIDNGVFAVTPQLPVFYQITGLAPIVEFNFLGTIVSESDTTEPSIENSRQLPLTGHLADYDHTASLLVAENIGPIEDARFSLPLDTNFLAVIGLFNNGNTSLRLEFRNIPSTIDYFLYQNPDRENLIQNLRMESFLVEESFFTQWYGETEIDNLGAIIANTTNSVITLPDGTGYRLVWRLVTDQTPPLDPSHLLSPEAVAARVRSVETGEAAQPTSVPTEASIEALPTTVSTQQPPQAESLIEDTIYADVDMYNPETLSLISIESESISLSTWQDVNQELWRRYGGTANGVDKNLINFGQYPLINELLIGDFWETRQQSNWDTIYGVMIIPENGQVSANQEANLSLMFSSWEQHLASTRARGFNTPNNVNILYIRMPLDQLTMPYEHKCYINQQRTTTPCTTINGSTQIAWPSGISWLAIDSNPFVNGMKAFSTSILFPDFQNTSSPDDNIPDELTINAGWEHEQNHLLNTADAYRYRLSLDGSAQDSNGAVVPVANHLHGWSNFHIDNYYFDQWDLMHGGNPYISDFNALQISLSRSQGLYSAMFENPIPYHANSAESHLIFEVTDANGGTVEIADNMIFMFGEPATATEAATHPDSLTSANRGRMSLIGNGARFQDIFANYTLGIKLQLNSSDTLLLPVPQIFQFLETFKDPHNENTDDYRLTIQLNSQFQENLELLRSAESGQTLHVMLAADDTYTALATNSNIRMLAESDIPIHQEVYSGRMRMVWFTTDKDFNPYLLQQSQPENSLLRLP